MSIDRRIDTLAARKAGHPKTTGSLQPMPDRCGGQLTFTGTSPENPPRYCMCWPAKGRRRCKRFHNGQAACGQDVASFKHGRLSRYGHLSPRVFERFAEALADEQLLDLKPDIAMLDVLKQEAERGLEVGASTVQLERACETFLAIKAAQTPQQFRAAMIAHGEALAAATQAAEVREEAGKAIERKGKLVKTYRQLQIESEDLIPAKRVGVVMAMLAALVREFIEDTSRRREFSQRFIGLLGPRLRGESIDAK